ncbi:hypothetical protein B0H15DRAFT_224936 [Mycena belliarum]|uniref:Uncharacterized protein n=1 Tax=Mycena belliarum TaxID=1033014 RepID=A0AAD6UMI3_9AGAR|nr:hypothetical protein B0H15DRAFT_224936 [Mycena belliae]
MHQAGWLRLRPFASPKFTRHGDTCLRFLLAHLVRDNSSFHQNAITKVRRPAAPRRAVFRWVPTELQANRKSRPSNSSQNNAPIGLTVQRATSQNSLYRNLLLLASSRSSFPVLLDYHELHADFRSLKSYNFLISLAIRHVAYGTVQSLLNGMGQDQIPGNFETLKLKTRWFVRSGLWEHAWLHVTASYPTSIPLPLWLEFFHGTKAGALHKPITVTMPVNSPLTRFQILMQNLPTFRPTDARSSVRAIRIVVHAMLSLDQPQSALALATRYFHSLPRRMDEKWAGECVDIIDSLVAFEANKKGLLDFYRTRRLLNSMLALHPSFRPTPKTLYLLLGTLRQAKECGTESWHTLGKFKARWGPEIENRRIRRRVASYAVIERRLDIADKVFEAERRSRQTDATTGPPSQLVPRPFRELFPRHGHEQRLWVLLKARALKVRSLLNAQKG